MSVVQFSDQVSIHYAVVTVISMKEMIADKIRGPDFGPLIFWAIGSSTGFLLFLFHFFSNGCASLIVVANRFESLCSWCIQNSRQGRDVCMQWTSMLTLPFSDELW